MKKSVKNKIKRLIAGVTIAAAAFALGTVYGRYSADKLIEDTENGKSSDYIDINGSKQKQELSANAKQADTDAVTAETLNSETTAVTEETEKVTESTDKGTEETEKVTEDGVYSESDVDEEASSNKAYADAAGFDDTPDLANNRNELTDGLININYASYELLVSVNGIGAKTAQNIIDYRREHGPFRSIENIKDVSGIGAKNFEKIKDKICAVE